MRQLAFLAIICLTISCGGGGTQTTETTTTNSTTTSEKFNNITVLLDLSSRVNLPNQVSKDTQIVKSILNAFEVLQRKYAFMASKDKLNITLAYQNSSVYDVYKIGNTKFSIDMTNKVGQNINKPIFDQKRADMESAVSELYQKAIGSPTDGADIWGFFCNDWHNYYKPDMKNKVIILTDGYLQFDKAITSKRPKGTYMTGLDKLRNKSDWEELLPNLKLSKCTNPIENTEVLILEVVPQNKAINTNEFQIIQKFWKTWFSDMNVSVEVFESDDISGNDTRISNFLTK